MTFKTLHDFDVKGKAILLRADLNVPVKDGAVTDTTRIDRLKPTIDYLISNQAKLVILSHFGRPDGERKAEFSLSQIKATCEKQWGITLGFADDCIGKAAEDAVKSLKNGSAVMLENLRFHKEEEKNDKGFVGKLAVLGDIYINDAFSCAHRAHASTEGLAHVLPSGAGFLMQDELNALNAALESPKKPVAAIVGGAKISTKLSVLNNLVKKVDFLILGGGMANTFLFAHGVEVGKSLCEKDMAEEARAIMAVAQNHGCSIILPEDQVVVREFKENAAHETVLRGKIGADQESMDVGAKTVATISGILAQCKTVLWNGPLGVFEFKPFDAGTNAVAKDVARLTSAGTIISVAGGGDTVSALENAGCVDGFTYVSTAGGAFLEWLEGKTLPGVAALLKPDRAA